MRENQGITRNHPVILNPEHMSRIKCRSGKPMDSKISPNTNNRFPSGTLATSGSSDPWSSFSLSESSLARCNHFLKKLFLLSTSCLWFADKFSATKGSREDQSSEKNVSWATSCNCSQNKIRNIKRGSRLGGISQGATFHMGYFG